MSRLFFDLNNMMAERTRGRGFNPDELENAADMAAAAYCAVSGRHLGSVPSGGQGDVLDDILPPHRTSGRALTALAGAGHRRLGAAPLMHQALVQLPVKSRGGQYRPGALSAYWAGWT